jgi:hypothetical protein
MGTGNATRMRGCGARIRARNIAARSARVGLRWLRRISAAGCHALPRALRAAASPAAYVAAVRLNGDAHGALRARQHLPAIHSTFSQLAAGTRFMRHLSRDSAFCLPPGARCPSPFLPAYLGIAPLDYAASALHSGSSLLFSCRGAAPSACLLHALHDVLLARFSPR